MENNNIKTCKEEFEGETVFLAKGSMTVDVAKVQSSEDILLHVMGGVGASVGVLGLVSVSVKVKVANPKPKTDIPEDGALYLSEIELGGNELFLVTLEFESEKQKVDVEITVTFKILFWSVSAKVKFVHETFKSKAKARIQFKSSWRQELDVSFSDLGSAIPKIEEIENMYMKGPQELRSMSNEDEKSHSFYYFSSWKQNPYGAQFNPALVHHDLDFLNDQITEMKSVIQINILKDKSWSADQRRQMVQLNQTLTTKTSDLTTGLEKYHKLSVQERSNLRQIYGVDKAPLYYTRRLNKIVQ
ncbi:uncharacterized protein TNIN_298881 [Trichonephila inaurata madagascariensis]|uniref:Uncharacterized protein n=1 Tax=Trichonephila inaurata madagascariensis TaxID=2747483 RepID=A0A8X6XJD0_9ARAC|nr:uncharacterized protein TNIN_298881 [Trichonephila inaurata madagascariensis]